MTLRLRLHRDGAPVVEDQPAVEARPTADDPAHSATVEGVLQLSRTIKPGEYQLQLEVTDRRTRGKAGTAHQWIDFTVASPR